MRASRLKAEEVEAKLREFSGNYAAVGRALGVTRAAISLYVKNRPALKAVAEECRETFLDNIESAIYKEALNGNVTAQIFILKTLGKDRGYIEHQKIELALAREIDAFLDLLRDNLEANTYARILVLAAGKGTS